jgi:D-methionine transport system ATP-binding protein
MWYSSRLIQGALVSSVIKVKKLSKIFSLVTGKEHFALDGLDFEVKSGDIFGFIGMSGAGKSTLLRCLSGLETPTSGSIWIEGEEMSSFSPFDLRKARLRMGIIFQHFNLLSSRTALENVMFPLELQQLSKKQMRETATELLTLVELKGKEHVYPANLSGGEKQRVAIARALATQPAILLADEFTSALDPATTRSILDLLSNLNQKLGITILLITHEMEVIKRICNHVAVLDHGKIVESGAVSSLFAEPHHPTTKLLLQNVSHEIPPHFLLKKEGTELVRLSFKGSTANKPLISHLMKKFDIEVNILLGGIDSLKNEMIGNLIVEMKGEAKERALVRAYLEKEGVICEDIL